MAMQNITTFLVVLTFTTVAGVGGFLTFDILGARASASVVGLLLLVGALAVFTVRFLRGYLSD